MSKPPIPITVTKLEMKERPAHVRPQLPHSPDHARAMLMKLDSPPVHFYRYLYDTVGKDYVWVARRRMGDDAIAAIVGHTNVEIYVLYVGGCPAGFAELDFRKRGEAELAYFGLLPEFIGRGYGTYLLGSAIDVAWSHEIERLWVHTNTLDHSRALPLYQKLGFTPYAQEKAEIVPID
ncbi:MAG: GNAT family N-acetyltransferase [Alphaproteobacteria bacterium]|nr:GNAT family N-acetyltransferase [Alphaproteobacteria bacterium]